MGRYILFWIRTLNSVKMSVLPKLIDRFNATSIKIPADFLKMKIDRDFPGGPVVKNPPSNAGDAGSIPGGELRSHMPWGK